HLVEQVLAETRALDRLQELLGDDHVGVDIDHRERRRDAGQRGELLHPVSLESEPTLLCHKPEGCDKAVPKSAGLPRGGRQSLRKPSKDLLRINEFHSDFGQILPSRWRGPPFDGTSSPAFSKKGRSNAAPARPPQDPTEAAVWLRNLDPL